MIRKIELELLLAGDEKEERSEDFNIRQLLKLQNNKKSKEETTSGQEFQINLLDARFQALFDGMDDRFGIDKSDPNFKPADGMKRVLSEQSSRRKRKKE